MTPIERLRQLKALNVLTKQDVFDLTVIALRIQRRQSMGKFKTAAGNMEEVCMYRSPEGLRCAAGHHIRDDEYDRKMENLTSKMLLQSKLASDSLKERLAPHKNLIFELQKIHDNATTTEDSERLKEWEYEWQKLAANENLKYTPPENS